MLAALGKLTAMQTSVTQSTPDHQVSGMEQDVQKTLQFSFESRDELNNLVISPALMGAWLSESATPDKTGTPVNFTADGTGRWTGTVTVTFDGWSAGTARKKYYLHYYDSADTVETLEMDVHSPNITANITASRTGEGVYTFTGKVQEVLGQTDAAYNPSGRLDMGFSLQAEPTITLGGSTSSIAQALMVGIRKADAGESDDLRFGLHQIEEVSDAAGDGFGIHSYQVTLSLGAQNDLLTQYGQNFTAYLFL